MLVFRECIQTSENLPNGQIFRILQVFVFKYPTQIFLLCPSLDINNARVRDGKRFMTANLLCLVQSWMLPTQFQSTWYVSGKSLTHESLLNWYTTSPFARHLLQQGIPLEHHLPLAFTRWYSGRSKAYSYLRSPSKQPGQRSIPQTGCSK